MCTMIKRKKKITLYRVRNGKLQERQVYIYYRSRRQKLAEIRRKSNLYKRGEL